MRFWKRDFGEKMRYTNCEFCEKWDFEIVIFVKSEIFKMWFLDKLRIFAPVWSLTYQDCVEFRLQSNSSWHATYWWKMIVEWWLCRDPVDDFAVSHRILANRRKSVELWRSHFQLRYRRRHCRNHFLSLNCNDENQIVKKEGCKKSAYFSLFNMIAHCLKRATIDKK